MSAETADYLLPAGLSLAEARAALSAHLRIEAGAVAAADLTFYDTFDGLLHARGLQLVSEGDRLKVLGDGELASAAHTGRPQRLSAAELPAGPLRDLVAPVIDVRAVIPIARIRRRLQPLRVVDGEGKTVVRIVVDAPAVAGGAGLRPRLHVHGVRGYDKALARVQRTLEDELALPPAELPLADEAVAATGGTPGGVSSRLELDLRPDERADAAAAALLLRLLDVVEQNLPGTLADVDSEFLHDLRVAVRRSRSAQRQLRHVFPPARLAHFRAEFRWLQQVTGPVRDLDVYLLELDHFSSALPEALHPDLGPLRGLLAERRSIERRRMTRALRSARYRTIVAEWRALLDGLTDLPEDDRPDAARPIESLAGERIGSVYRSMVKAGRAIDDASPPEALHDLRKTGKELRYLLEFFAGLYPDSVVKPMVKTLKALQDTLGRFQDREVQAHMLRSLRDEVAALDDGPAALMAMGLLVDRLLADQAAAHDEFAERFAAFAAAPQRALVKATFG